MNTEPQMQDSNAPQHVVVKKTMAIWQKFLVYPAVFGALFGAVPTVMDIYNAWKYDVKYSTVRHAEEQRALWEKNFACTSSLNYQKVRTDKDVEVQVGACNNGDVLISVLQPNGEKIVEWVSIEKLRNASATAGLLVGTAFATGLAPQHIYSKRNRQSNVHLASGKVETVCQELIKSKAMISRIVKENNVCYGEIVSMMKGSVSKRISVPCNTQCKTFYDEHPDAK